MNETFMSKLKTLAINIRNFFCWSAGAVNSIIEKCPSEQIKYTAIGVMMVFIAILSCVSFTVFLTISYEFNPLIALLGGVVW